MKSIYIAAFVTMIISLAILMFIILRLCKERLSNLLVFFILALPGCYLAYMYIRLPIDSAIRLTFHISQYSASFPVLYVLITGLYAPVIEELTKLLPFAIPTLRRKTLRINRMAVAMTIGFGFGIGEMWLIAYWLSRNPLYAEYHWYQLGGFIIERSLVCFCHGVFTAVALRGFAGKMIRSIIYAMGLHLISNLPIILYGGGFLRIGQVVYNNFMIGYLLVFSILLYFVLIKVIKNNADSVTFH